MTILLTFFVLLLGNVWIWKVFTWSPFAGILLLILSIFLYLYLLKNNRFFLIGFLALMFLSLFLTKSLLAINLTYSSQETLLMQQRLKEYPPITLLPVAHWLEERPETIAVYQFTNNFSELVDPNLYFFANHPRERAGISEIEKFPYILLPFFVLGVLELASKKSYSFFLVSLGLPLIYYSVYGVGGGVQPYLLFPFFVISIYEGLKKLFEWLTKVGGRYKTAWVLSFWLIYILVLTQSILYAIY